MSKEKLVLQDSTKRFPDRAHYRIEVSGIETAEILRAVIDEAKKQNIPIHRAIATVAGSKFYSDAQLMDLEAIAAEYKVEVIICPDDLAHGFFKNPNRNLNWQNTGEMQVYIDQVLRCIDIGFRGFLVWTSPMLRGLNNLRSCGSLPKETIFKVSTFANSCNVADFLSHAKDGANTINAANGLTLENLSEIRRVSDKKIAIDVHITFWQQEIYVGSDGFYRVGVKPYDRIKDAPEIARICSPVYFKFEAGTPGISVYDVPRPDWTFKDLAEHKREDVRTAAKIVRTIKKRYSYLKLSDWGPDDLRVPIISG